MHRATSILINSFESMQRASGNAVDSSAIQEAREELAKAGNALDEIEQNIRDAQGAQDDFNDSLRGGSGAAESLLEKIKGFAAAVGGLVAINKIMQISDEWASNKARLNLLVDDGGSLPELEQKVMASAQRSRSAYFDTASAVAKLGLNAGAAFDHDMNQVIAFMEQVNKQFVIGGATAQEQSNAMTQLTQAMAAGALRGEELNSILDGAPGIARAIEQYMGVAEGSIKTYAEQGLVTASVVKNALFEMADETNAKFDSMPKTWAQIWISMQNKALSIFGPILTKLNQIANSTRFDTIIAGLIDGLAGIASVATVVLDLLINVASVVVDNWSWIAPIIWGVVAALIAYNAVMGIGWLTTLKTIAAKVIHAAVSAAETAAIIAMTAAQQGLNAALALCPITWIIVAIIALIALFYAAVAAVNKFAGTSVSATGLICGAFMWVLSVIGNILIALWNIVVDVFVLIYNLIASVANFIGNVFNDPIGSIARLFFDLADTVLGVLQTLASAIDAVFGSNLSETVQGWRDNLGGWVDDTFGKGEEIMAKLNAEDLKLDRFENKAAFDLGYRFGEGIDKKVSGLFDFSNIDNIGAGTFDGIYNNTGETAANTAASADSLDLNNEELEWMRDLAEQEAINRFTTTEIRVDMGGVTQNVASYLDAETLTHRMVEAINSGTAMGVEGVYA